MTRARGWVEIGLIYVAARLVTTALMVLTAARAAEGSRHGVDPSLSDFVVGWDAGWYQRIAEDGYPHTLPVNAEGLVEQNAWAFMPGLAWITKPLAALLGSWGPAVLVVSLVAGYLACIAYARLLRGRLDRTTILWGVAFLAAAPLSPLFQVGYAESLALLWLMLALVCLAERRYRWLWLLVPLLGFTRPGVLALVPVFVALVWWRRTDWRPLLGLAAWAAAVGFSWPWIVGLVTGESGGYLETELSWRRGFVGDGPFVPFGGLVDGADFWFQTDWGLSATTEYVVLGAVALVIVGVLAFTPQVRRLGPEARLWSAAHLLYLAAVVFPQSSLWRLQFPTVAPLWAALAVPRSVLWRLGVLGVLVYLQWVWFWHMYGEGNAYWLIP